MIIKHEALSRMLYPALSTCFLTPKVLAFFRRQNFLRVVYLPNNERVLIYAELKDENLPVHIIVDYSVREEPVIVTAYVPDSRYWLNYKTRKTRK